MKNNFPGLLSVLGPDEKNGFIKSKGLWVPVGRAFPQQLPMVAIDQQIAGAAVDAVLRKLMCALHYKHTGNILPVDGTITVKWCTNAALSEFMTDDMKAFEADLTEQPTLVRNGKDLSDQFDYRYRTSDDGKSSMYFVKFRQSIFGVGVVRSEPGDGMEAVEAGATDVPQVAA
jgi:hypothetical protein